MDRTATPTTTPASVNVRGYLVAGFMLIVVCFVACAFYNMGYGRGQVATQAVSEKIEAQARDRLNAVVARCRPGSGLPASPSSTSTTQ